MCPVIIFKVFACDITDTKYYNFENFIEDLSKHNTHIAACVAMHFFGQSYVPSYDANPINWSVIKQLFDDHCNTYHITTEIGDFMK